MTALVALATSGGIPAAYSMLGDLLGTIIAGVEPEFAVVKLEGDAVFAAASAASLDSQGDRVLKKLGTMYRDGNGIEKDIDRATEFLKRGDELLRTACSGSAKPDYCDM